MTDSYGLGSSRDRISPNEIISRKFALVRRGYKPEEVNKYLALLASYVDEQHKILDGLNIVRTELESQLSTLRNPGPQKLDIASVTAALGEEAADILRSATDAAASIRNRATEYARDLTTKVDADVLSKTSNLEKEIASRFNQHEAAIQRLTMDANERIANEVERATQAARTIVADARNEANEIISKAKAVRSEVYDEIRSRTDEAKDELRNLAGQKEQIFSWLDQIQRSITEIAPLLIRNPTQAEPRSLDADLELQGSSDAGLSGFSSDSKAELDLTHNLASTAPVVGTNWGNSNGEAAELENSSFDDLVEAEAELVRVLRPGLDVDVASSELEEIELHADENIPYMVEVEDAKLDSEPLPIGTTTPAINDFVQDTNLEVHFDLSDKNALGDHVRPASEIVEPLLEVPAELEGQSPENLASEHDSGSIGLTNESSPAEVESVTVEAGLITPPRSLVEGIFARLLTPDSESLTLKVESEASGDSTDDRDIKSGPLDGIGVVTSEAIESDAEEKERTSTFESDQVHSTDAFNIGADVQDVADASLNDFLESSDLLQEDLVDGVSQTEDEPITGKYSSIFAPIQSQISRRVKRVLQDDQNELLDRLRTTKAKDSITLIGSLEHLSIRYLEVLGPFVNVINESARAFYAMYTSTITGGTDLLNVTEDASDEMHIVARDLAQELAVELIGRIDRVLDREQSDDDSGITSHLGATFRSLKSEYVETLAKDFVSSLASTWLLTCTDAKKVIWMRTSKPGCSDCEDNELEGSVDSGMEFPTGSVAPPGHIGCECLLLPEFP